MLRFGTIVLLGVWALLSANVSAQSVVRPFYQPDYRFSINVPAGWVIDQRGSSSSREFFFHSGLGDAVSVSSRPADSSKLEFHRRLAKEGLSEKDRKTVEHFIEREVPYKKDVVVTLETISNKPAFTQTYVYEHRAVGTVLYLKSATFEVVHLDRVFLIGVSAGAASTKEKAEQQFRASMSTFFRPMLLSLIFYE